jgi:RNA polymerase sigma-70 factor (ECF subfamily)
MTDQEICDGLKSGSSQAFATLYRAHGSAVVSYLTRVTGRKEMTEELTQETFLTALKKIAFFKPIEGVGLKQWLFRIATHLAIDELRRHKRISPFKDPSRPPSIPSTDLAADLQLENAEEFQAVQEALKDLSDSQRLIIILRIQENLSLMEISKICGCSINAIKQSLFRSKAFLKESLCNKI